MILIEALFALAIALFLTVVFVVLGRRAKPRRKALFFFGLVFLGAWAGGIWITPVGPRVLGVYWLSFFVAGLTFALVEEALAALSPKAGARDTEEALDRSEEGELRGLFSTFSFILFLVFLALIILGILRRRG